MRRTAVVILVVTTMAAPIGGCTGTLHLGTQITALAPR